MVHFWSYFIATWKLLIKNQCEKKFKYIIKHYTECMGRRQKKNNSQETQWCQLSANISF